jgi:DNA (cytosine-5)-methyltransferase 1
MIAAKEEINIDTSKAKGEGRVGNSYNVIDLFCGCGGFSKGFQQAGFRICFGIDLWNDATTTYKHNFSDAVTLNEDITKVTGDEIIKQIGIRKDDVDVIIGGPPCQGFSVSGKGSLMIRETNCTNHLLV